MGEGVRPHYHSSLEVNLLQNVRGSVRVEGNVWSLQSRTVLLIPPGTVHSYDILPGSDRIHILHLAFRMMRKWINPESLADCLTGRPLSDLEPLEEERIASGLKEIIPSLGAQWPSLSYLDPICSSQVLFFLLPFFSRSVDGPSKPLSKREEERLRRLIDYAEEHYASPIPVESAARICGMSRSSFCRFFPAVTGSSWNRYLTELRLDSALSLLQEGISVAESALSCGFYDSSHFSRHFRRRFGVNPSSFKK